MSHPKLLLYKNQIEPEEEMSTPLSNLRLLGVGKRVPQDPMFAAGDALCRMFVREGVVDLDDEQLCHQVVVAFPCEVPGCRETFSSLLDFELHYNCRHRNICSQCRKPLLSAHLLDLHISESHDSFFAAQAERKPMFRCFVEDCLVVSKDISERRSHCIEVHNFPHDFRYDQSLKKGKKTNNQKTGKESEAMVVDEAHQKKPTKKKPFTFGHTKGKAFSSKPWHTQGKVSSKETQVPTGEINTSELMDTLPSCS
uniref:C2H2-type domain-containing protein n=1 Tax=Graphocephala atropunctata TaxID=36148 RepID=A0A1B6L1Q9_9HEMI